MTLFLSFRNSRAGVFVRAEPYILRSAADVTPSSFDLQSFVHQAGGRDVLFAIHGYNNSEEEAVCKLSRLESLLNLPPSALLVGILWPGDSLAGFISYPFEKPTARYAGRHLAAFCNKRLSDAASISFVSHSLGARVALETVRHLDRKTRSVCLMAAAIERHCLEREYADAFARIDMTYVLASKQDSVLEHAFPLGNFIGHLLDPTSKPLSKALGFAGPPKAIGKTQRPWQITDTDNYAHGDYLPPCDPDVDFPPPPRSRPKYAKTADFVRRAFDLERQIWPVPG